MNAADQMTKVIQNANILDFARHYGVDVDDDLKTRCFVGHDLEERTLQFDPENRSFHCTKPDCRYHGNVIDLVQMYEGLDLDAALCRMAELQHFDSFSASQPEEFDAIARARACLQRAAQHYARNLHGAVPFLESRGISPLTGERYLIGATRGENDLKDFLITEGFTELEIRQAGLLNSHGNDFFRNRIIVPIRIGGHVVSFYGRSLDEQTEFKHLRMSNDRVIIGTGPFNWNPDHTEIIATEGILDALSLIDKGFVNATAVYGTQGLSAPDNMERLKESAVKRVYLCYDGDDSGRNATAKDAYELEDQGLDVKIVDIGQQDPNEFMLGNEPEDFKEKLTSAASPIQWALAQIDPSWEPEKKIEALEPVFRRCKRMQPLKFEATVGRIAKELGFSKPIVKKHIESLATEDDGAAILVDLSEHVTIHPALDFVNGKALMMVSQMRTNGGKGKAAWIPYTVTSEREMFVLDAEELQKRGYCTETDVVPVRPRYTPKTVAGFLSGNLKGDLPKTFRDIHSILVHYLDFEDPRTLEYLTTWIIGTYFFPIFNYYPYLHLTGTKNVGKSKTVMLMSCLCFNAVLSASMTAASLFRSVDGARCTVLMDETEYLHQREFSDKRLIMNGGFQKGSYVSRTEKEGDGYRVRQLHNYCPKAFASIEGLDDTLASRTVQLYMHRSRNDAIKEREVALADPMFQSLRDELFLVAMTYGPAVQNIYESVSRPEEVEFGDREFNLFKPILTIGLATQNDALVKKLTDFANISFRQKMFQHNETAEENVLLRYLLEAVVEDGWFRGDNLHEGFVNFLKGNGLDVGRQITKSRLGQLLRKLQVVSEDRRSTDRKTTTYLLQRQNLESVAANYQVM